MKRLAVALGAIGLAALTACNTVRYVERVTIVNPYEYTLHAEVGRGASGWLNLGGVEREGEETIEQVIDMGERWVFRFRFGDIAEEQVTFSRAELAGRGWRVEVPKALPERLRKAGEPPSFK